VGLSAALRWEALRLSLKLGRPEPPIWRVRPQPVIHPIRARLRGSSDMKVFDQIFIYREYACLLDLKDPSLVLDLGANVGFSSAYFLSVFPTARVVAVEPDERNIAMCRDNLSSYGDRTLVLHGAVWSKTAKLRVLKGVFADGLEWATQVEESLQTDEDSAWAQAWDVGTIIEMAGGGTVDLLKIDIERSELSVFTSAARTWLHKVRNICIELHGRDCEEAFFAALREFEYDLSYSGELAICRNLRPKHKH
jgi:FkbM family methyltransferase